MNVDATANSCTLKGVSGKGTMQRNGPNSISPSHFSSRCLWVLTYKFKRTGGKKTLYLSYQVAVSSEHFHLKISVRAVNNIGFIHYTGDSRILVNYNLS